MNSTLLALNKKEIPPHLRKFFKPRHVIKPRDDMAVPERVALALVDDGWYLRSRIIWAKSAPMPESVQSRPTSAHEHVFLLTKKPSYYFDHIAVQEQGGNALTVSVAAVAIPSDIPKAA
jgi:hypothetical protein